ncbi:MAG: hypothetical protein RR618_03990 [Cellulosilyticaceae bacterium]
MSKEEMFFSKSHKKEFLELLEQANLEEHPRQRKSQLEYRQVAFLYLIALYQEEYKRYEGCKFYIEDLGELSLDGPVYLLEERYISLKEYDHEIMLDLAINILKKMPLQRRCEGLSPHLQEPLKIAISLSEGTLINNIV